MTKFACECRTNKGVKLPNLNCKQGVKVEVGVIDEIGTFVWYRHTILAFKVKKFVNLATPLADEDLKLLSNPDTSNLLIKLQHHLIDTIYYHNDRIYNTWREPAWNSSPIPAPYSAKNSWSQPAYTFAIPFRRRGRNAMPFPTKWAVFGLIDRALAGSSNI